MKKIITEFSKNRWNYLFVIPAALYTFLFGYATLPYMIIAFQDFDYQKGIGSEWVGLENFEFFFGSTRAWEVTRNTILLNFLFIVFGTIFAIMLALLINEVKNKYFIKITQSTMLLPYFLSWVIISYVLYAVLSTDRGVINSMLESLGLDRIHWYSEAKYWRGILVIVRLWKDAGYNSIIYLAAITGMDINIHQAAKIDGASRWQGIRYITIPLLMPTVSILALLQIGRMFYGDFGMIYALVKDSGQLLPKVDVIDTYVFRMLRITGDPSASMAVGVYQSVVGFILVFSSNAIVKKYYPDGMLF